MAGNQERLGVEPWEKPDGTASDYTFVRRLYLDLAGRIPTCDEADRFVSDATPDKDARLVDELLRAPDHYDYWTMRLADVLRVKSEFPVNLWPNAVYVYHRRIRAFVAKGESWSDFARALLTAKGSNFRDAEVNFTRAVAVKTPFGFAEAAVRTFLGEELSAWPQDLQKKTIAYFEPVRIKYTREWKEEIVLTQGDDLRGAFCDWLLQERRDAFCRAFVLRVSSWLFSETYAKALPSSAVSAYTQAFVAGDLRLAPLVRAIVLSSRYRMGPITGGFPLCRLDAEVLEDVLCTLTGAKRHYLSIAPEPFTFIPPDRRTIALEDGSITSAFLLLFGRPPRDTGLLSERDNTITAKQRLYLYNSGSLYNQLQRVTSGNAALRTLPEREQVEALYMRFLTRLPTQREQQDIAQARKGLTGRVRWRFLADLAWCLVNGKEFLYRH